MINKIIEIPWLFIYFSLERYENFMLNNDEIKISKNSIYDQGEMIYHE
jgi:hypothetical protein